MSSRVHAVGMFSHLAGSGTRLSGFCTRSVVVEIAARSIHTSGIAPSETRPMNKTMCIARQPTRMRGRRQSKPDRMPRSRGVAARRRRRSGGVVTVIGCSRNV